MAARHGPGDGSPEEEGMSPTERQQMIEAYDQIYAAHAHGHASQIRRLRQALGG